MALEADTDLRRLLEEVSADKTARLIERDGQPLAVVIPPEEYASLTSPPRPARSPREFYDEAVHREDVRHILRRLATE